MFIKVVDFLSIMPIMPIYIIEHLEEKLWPWCVIEYKHIAAIVGKKNVLFTNVKSRKLDGIGETSSQSIVEIYRKKKLKNICVLDPAAAIMLKPKEAKTFDCFIFGGILGDYPPQKRTESELTSKMRGISARNIGTKQMSTDTAVYVVHEIVSGKKLSAFTFQDGVEIALRKHESTVLPYRYVVIDGKSRLSKELVKFLKKKTGI